MTDRLDRVMAYVDGELDDGARRAFEAEMTADPTLAAEVAAHRELAERLSEAYGPVVREAVPLRLDLAARTANDQARPRIGTWAAVAASLVVGVVAGRFALAPEPAIAVGIELPARTELARALDRQLAAEPGVVRIGITFRDAQGRYCRTFQSAADRLAGLACRGDGRWRVTTATAWTPAAGPDYRTAASGTPPEVLAAVDRALEGETLDASQEKAARDAGWR
ncbi:MAG: anti-sigma factor [Phenylobacterium sp.]|uniref:anti-sigma factor family protein n=1 Tax=Phenylobacterium sp. TaxID=1871053 RepID=UPI0011F4FF6B|nr:hypothetical protein [Phenylobacterium sp.]TAJ74846.1 MAG: anti-sigma factor [Phenylobacterium sp.]